MIKRLSAAAVAIFLSTILAGCMTVSVPEGQFFYPDTRVQAEKLILAPGPAIPGAETLSLPFAGGAVAATRVRTGRADAPLILYCGGNLFRRGVAGAQVAAELAPFGDVLMFDYPGSGDTPGQASFATYRDAGEVIAATARAQADAEGRRLIAWGHSLGGPICAEAARVIRADAVVLEATTPTARAAVDSMVGLWRPIVRVQLAEPLTTVDVPATLDGYSGKVVVLEASRDTTLPPTLSRKLAHDLRTRGVNVERLVFARADHGDIPSQPDFVTRVGAALN
ncbi:alpha/beta hydrolase family protein [Brevundimonas vesicularis]|uniref:Alpha/beta fold hydrolase n=1 Tax=Brevundimonas vesicularis TaxID=41276 RepID=A0A1Z3UBA9_BREVE|nr:alpha/beta fold hydrolase [Brevundimonas vesicularis]ASE40548.1 alpha/beta hydrolase [Brevundimonas vesicularis]MDX2334560.1 alpha/beta fold hydrolase [Brevundimonas vesicularis]